MASKSQEQRIFALFLKNERLRFSEIEKSMHIRSNKLAYYLDNLKKKGLLEKKNYYYYPSKKGESLIPVFSNISGDKQSPVPVVLVALTSSKKILLMKRKRRPYKDYWSLIGGKMLLHESIEESARRLVLEKSGIAAHFERVASVSHERLYSDDDVTASFILIFVKMSADATKSRGSDYGDVKWFDISRVSKSTMIPSDYFLITKKLKSKQKMKEFLMEENDGKLRLI